MATPPLVSNQLTAHRIAAWESKTRMRATNAEMREMIQRTMKVLHDTRDAISRLDAELRALYLANKE